MIHADSDPAALTSRSPDRQWQPIETAPKDGTFILISGGKPGYGWDSYKDFLPPCVVAAFFGGDWQFASYDSGSYGIWERPTHWMSLPASPSNGDRDVEAERAGDSMNQTSLDSDSIRALSKTQEVGK